MDGVRGLFDPRLNASQAVSRFVQSCRRRGKWRPVELRDNPHTLIVSPTGGGKGTAFIIPELLNNPESMVVVDIKGDLNAITAEHRRRIGHEVVVLNPFYSKGQSSDRFNPLDFIDRDSITAMDDCRDLAASLVVRPPEEKEPHWSDSAEQLIASMLMSTIQFAKPGMKNLQFTRLLLTDQERMKQALGHMAASEAWDGLLKREADKVNFLTGKEFASVMTTSNRHMRIFDTPRLVEHTSSSSTFNPSRLVWDRMTVYLVIPPDRFDANAGLLRMWISSLMRAIFREGLQ